mmetsp:Transcript_152997/g.282014  ORF Transcript_152997/g.282014 Transcript_152997/m.282014 type:complete len:215 (+) Transcript_152997:833-1477(+)
MVPHSILQLPVRTPAAPLRVVDPLPHSRSQPSQAALRGLALSHHLLRKLRQVLHGLALLHHLFRKLRQVLHDAVLPSHALKQLRQVLQDMARQHRMDRPFPRRRLCRTCQDAQRHWVDKSQIQMTARHGNIQALTRVAHQASTQALTGLELAQTRAYLTSRVTMQWRINSRRLLHRESLLAWSPAIPRQMSQHSRISVHSQEKAASGHQTACAH